MCYLWERGRSYDGAINVFNVVFTYSRPGVPAVIYRRTWINLKHSIYTCSLPVFRNIIPNIKSFHWSIKDDFSWWEYCIQNREMKSRIDAFRFRSLYTYNQDRLFAPEELVLRSNYPVRARNSMEGNVQSHKMIEILFWNRRYPYWEPFNKTASGISHTGCLQINI